MPAKSRRVTKFHDISEIKYAEFLDNINSLLPRSQHVYGVHEWDDLAAISYENDV